uniref:Uncharacterized protein n=1 Tax=Anguilla anguilla TaxID=7936 RepID=A0A0E9SBF3_ANGAN
MAITGNLNFIGCLILWSLSNRSCVAKNVGIDNALSHFLRVVQGTCHCSSVWV